MESLICNWCSAGPFRRRRNLSTHQATCIERLRAHAQPLQDLPPPDNIVDFIEPTNEPLHLSQTPQCNLPIEPNAPHRPSNDVETDFDEPADDVLEIDGFDVHVESESSTFVYDSTFSIINWIRTCKKGGGLSNSDIDRLFKQVLFHPSFKLEDVSVKSSYDVENYEKKFYNEADGWKKEVIDGNVLHYRDPISALEALFSSPVVGENFTLQPIMTEVLDNSRERTYSTPATGNWWRLMQVSRKITIFKKSIYNYIFFYLCGVFNASNL